MSDSNRERPGAEECEAVPVPGNKREAKAGMKAIIVFQSIASSSRVRNIVFGRKWYRIPRLLRKLKHANVDLRVAYPTPKLLARPSCAVCPGEDQSGIEMREGPTKNTSSKQTLTDYPMIYHSRVSDVMGSANGPTRASRVAAVGLTRQHAQTSVTQKALRFSWSLHSKPRSPTFHQATG